MNVNIEEEVVDQESVIVKALEGLVRVCFTLYDQNESAFGAIIGGFIQIGQSERRTRSRIDFVKCKANS